MKGKAEHIATIQRFGYTETEAAFLYLVATHSGYFTRRQFLRYAQQSKGCLVHRFTAKTLTQGHATAKEYGYQTLVFNLFSRQIYGAIDKDNRRNRRQLSKELIRTRLLILDFGFVDRFPIFLTNEPLPTPTFVYYDSDLPGVFGYLTHVRNYEQLLRRLHGFNLVYASPDAARFRRAQGFFSRTFDSNTPWIPPNWPGISTSDNSGKVTKPSP